MHLRIPKISHLFECYYFVELKAKDRANIMNKPCFSAAEQSATVYLLIFELLKSLNYWNLYVSLWDGLFPEFLFTLLSYFSAFFFRTRNRVVDREDVFGVNFVFESILPLEGVRGCCTRNKLLPELAYSVVVRDAATCKHYLVSRSVFDSFILFNQMITLHSPMFQCHVNIDGSTCFIDLCNSEGDPDTFPREALSKCIGKNSFLDARAQ